MERTVDEMEYEIRGLKIRLRHLGDEYRCERILGMAMGSTRCRRDRDHPGDCDFVNHQGRLESGLRTISRVMDQATDSTESRYRRSVWVSQAVDDLLNGKSIVHPGRV